MPYLRQKGRAGNIRSDSFCRTLQVASRAWCLLVEICYDRGDEREPRIRENRDDYVEVCSICSRCRGWTR
ncbi:hypothetical protein C2E23DRAFT_838925 [Lenzites betulinus]|nr:hypothetical protein C2E23DRAFT_838925 [Lenzites betulinus]